jgi:hypothetical protein
MFRDIGHKRFPQSWLGNQSITEHIPKLLLIDQLVSQHNMELMSKCIEQAVSVICNGVYFEIVAL